jgi:hypothetical protein
MMGWVIILRLEPLYILLMDTAAPCFAQCGIAMHYVSMFVLCVAVQRVSDLEGK